MPRSVGLFKSLALRPLPVSPSPSVPFWRCSVPWMRLAVSVLLTTPIVLAALALGLYAAIEPELPSVTRLRGIQMQVPMSVYSRDGGLIARFGEEKRVPVRYAEVPSRMIHAIVAAEDDRFFLHPGVDYWGLLRASVKFLRTGEKKQGGSTITMQVARNFFLSSEKTFSRKLREIGLALRIERELSKEEILELYLNKIYLGQRAYGFGGAAQVYFGKPLADLQLDQVAMLAGLPKAPSRFNPLTAPEQVRERRDYVLQRMLKLGFIGESEFAEASRLPIATVLRQVQTEVGLHAPYVAEMVREFMRSRYGDAAYAGGWRVFTTLDGARQGQAQVALWQGLHDYDERHGFRGAEASFVTLAPGERSARLRTLEHVGDTQPALVRTVGDTSLTLELAGGGVVDLPWAGMKWARRGGVPPRKPRDVAEVGAVLRVCGPERELRLCQVPEVEGALVALDPRDGAVRALVGGFDFARSKYNRVTQASRQPGSGFKPIIYATALEHGLTPDTVVEDAPFSYFDPGERKEWRPQNYTGRYLGPVPLRVALAQSANTVAVRLAAQVGVRSVIDTALRFGFRPDQLPPGLSLSLGTGTATPLEMARMYAVFANGGFRVAPYFIERIEDRDGRVVFQVEPSRACPGCDPEIPRVAEQVLDPKVHFLMHGLLQGVIREGTARRALQLGRADLAGKTGTTNEQKDAWFNGYAANRLVAVSWVGFDSSKPLGEDETGGHTALPVWMRFMGQALEGEPVEDFIRPSAPGDVPLLPGPGAPVDSPPPALNGALEPAPSRVPGDSLF